MDNVDSVQNKIMIIIKYHRHRHLDLFCFEFYISFSHPEHEIYAVFVNLEINHKHICWIRSIITDHMS
jgi:hypothetical protein